MRSCCSHRSRGIVELPRVPAPSSHLSREAPQLRTKVVCHFVTRHRAPRWEPRFRSSTALGSGQHANANQGDVIAHGLISAKGRKGVRQR